ARPPTSAVLPSSPTRRSSDLAPHRLRQAPGHLPQPSEDRPAPGLLRLPAKIEPPRPAAALVSLHRASHTERTRVDRGCGYAGTRSEEHTSELQSRENLVCRLL